MIDVQQKLEEIKDFVSGKFSVDLIRNSTIYHYTTVSAYKSIIENKCLWASDVRYLNDNNEIKYGMNLLVAEIEKISASDEASDLYKTALSELKDFLFDDIGVCSVSFCMDDDLLSQWRGYGGVQGVSIGVSAGKIKDVDGFNLYSVVYDVGDQKRIIQSSLAFYFSRYTAVSRSGLEKSALKDFVRDCSYVFDRLAAVLKAPAFSEECEVRAFITKYRHRMANGVKFRERNGLIIPYYELSFRDLGVNFIKSVVVGPGANSDLALKSIQDFNLTNGIRCKHSLSSVALRG